MSLRRFARTAHWVVLCVLTVLTNANAQEASTNLKEIRVAADSFSLGDPIPAWAEPIALPPVGEIKPVIVRLADWQWRVGDSPVVYVHRAVMVNDAGSLASAGQISIQFVPEYQRLQLHSIHVLRGDESQDRTRSSTVRFLQRETGLEQGVYSGIVTVSILLSDLRVGDTIEYSYSLNGQNPVFGGKFFALAVWDQGYPTTVRRVILSYPAARKINWRFIGHSQSKPLTAEESTHDGMHTLRFEEQSIPQVTIELLRPSDYVPLRELQFSEFSRWDEVVNWASELFKIPTQIDDNVRKVVEKIRERPGTEEQVVAALEFVQSEIRYFSVSLGESSHRPYPPSLVLQRRYGDCKDKSLLLMTLLRELGVRSDPVLLKFGQRKGLDELLPSPQLFNHVIVRADVDGKIYYLDPTRLGQHGRLDRMGQAHEGAQVLVIAPETHQISTIISPNAYDLARNERSETATLPKLSPAGSLQTRQIWTGASTEALRVVRDRMSHDQLLKWISDGMEARYPGAKLAEEPKIEDDQVNNVFSITAVYDVPGLATEKDGNWIVRFAPSNLKGALPAPAPNRTSPAVIPGFPLQGLYTFEVKFPDELTSTIDPRSTTVKAKQFTYTVTSSFRGNVSKTAIELKTLADRVEVPDMPKYGEDIRQADINTGGFVFVPKGQIKSPVSGKKDLQQVLRDRLQESIDKFTETIKSGKLTGKDLATAYCYRAVSLADLGKTDDAVRDANQALELAPNEAEVYQCRAEVYFEAGEFDKSVADYSKAITLGAINADSFRGRGVSSYYAGRLDDAADDFAKASAAADKETQAYIDIWLVYVLQRLGKPLPEALAKRADDLHGDWPRPALAMLTGKITPEEMLATLNGKTGDDRQMALAEAYFYIGQHYKVLNDETKARAYFERTRLLGVITFTEHAAAAFELEQSKGQAEANRKTISR